MEWQLVHATSFWVCSERRILARLKSRAWHPRQSSSTCFGRASGRTRAGWWSCRRAPPRAPVPVRGSLRSRSVPGGSLPEAMLLKCGFLKNSARRRRGRCLQALLPTYPVLVGGAVWVGAAACAGRRQEQQQSRRWRPRVPYTDDTRRSDGAPVTGRNGRYFTSSYSLCALVPALFSLRLLQPDAPYWEWRRKPCRAHCRTKVAGCPASRSHALPAGDVFDGGQPSVLYRTGVHAGASTSKAGASAGSRTPPWFRWSIPPASTASWWAAATPGSPSATTRSAPSTLGRGIHLSDEQLVPYHDDEYMLRIAPRPARPADHRRQRPQGGARQRHHDGDPPRRRARHS